MRTSSEDRIQMIHEIIESSGVAFSGAETRYNKYIRKDITWEEALAPHRNIPKYDVCMVKCIKEETGISHGCAVGRWWRFFNGDIAEEGMFAARESYHLAKMLFFVYLGVKYYANDVKRITGCTIDQARRRIRKVRDYRMTPINALEPTKKKRNPMCAGMQPRRSIDSIQLGTWEVKQLEADR